MLPDSFQLFARDDDFLHFACAFVNLCQLGFAHEAFNMVFFHIAISPMNLNGFGCYFHRNIGCILFGHRAGNTIRFSLIFEPGGLET